MDPTQSTRKHFQFRGKPEEQNKSVLHADYTIVANCKRSATRKLDTKKMNKRGEREMKANRGTGFQIIRMNSKIDGVSVITSGRRKKSTKTSFSSTSYNIAVSAYVCIRNLISTQFSIVSTFVNFFSKITHPSSEIRVDIITTRERTVTELLNSLIATQLRAKRYRNVRFTFLHHFLSDFSALDLMLRTFFVSEEVRIKTTPNSAPLFSRFCSD